MPRPVHQADIHPFKGYEDYEEDVEETADIEQAKRDRKYEHFMRRLAMIPDEKTQAHVLEQWHKEHG